VYTTHLHPTLIVTLNTRLTPSVEFSLAVNAHWCKQQNPQDVHIWHICRGVTQPINSNIDVTAMEQEGNKVI